MRIPWAKNFPGPLLPVVRNIEPARKDTGSVSSVKFEDKWALVFRKASKKAWRKISKPSTGSLSDGGGQAMTRTNTNTSVAQRLQPSDDGGITESADGMWVVDETFVFHEPPIVINDQSSGSAKVSHQGSEHAKDECDRPHTVSARSGLMVPLISLTSWSRTSLGGFFDQSFADPEKELEYQKQQWYMQKLWAFIAAAFLVLNMVLYLTLNKDSNGSAPFNKYAYWGGLPIVTMPILPMVVFDYPRKYPILFQVWFTSAVWYCGLTEIINMNLCDYFLTGRIDCGRKDFLAMMSYNMGLPAIMMFVVTKRILNAFYMLVSVILVSALLIPEQGIFARNLVSMIVFDVFVQFISYQSEKNGRRVFTLTRNLKIERKSSDKARFTASKEQAAKEKLASYIFHEVRVPLNVAQLAFENLRAAHNIENHAEMWALDRSLNLMQKVLNDALDLSKMDSGSFDNDNVPFSLHRAIRSAMDPIMIVSKAKGITVECQLDPRVDALAQTQGSDRLWVVGDELRLRQILTNLATNAVKFCPESDGKILLRTTLMHPLEDTPTLDTAAEEKPDPSWDDVTGRKEFKQALDRHFEIRIECEDNGPGITPEDVRENRLFQPFVQAAAGKRSRRGTGLGLAIVRQIVALTGGQLGLKCSKGKGATFWVQMPYKLATKDEVSIVTRDPRATGFIHSQNRAAVMNLALPDQELPIFAALPVGPTPDSPGGTGAYFGLEDRTMSGDVTMTLSLTGPPHLVSTQSSRSDQSVISMETANELERHPIPPSLSLPPPEEIVQPPIMSTPPLEDLPDPLRVLIVDDDFLTRTIMGRTLQKYSGCLVDVAEDGQDFLDIMNDPERPTYDLVTLDNHMPVMTGEVAIEEFRKARRTEYVVGCTGNALVADTRKFLKAGVDDVLPKPLSKEKIDGILNEARRRRQERRALISESDS